MSDFTWDGTDKQMLDDLMLWGQKVMEAIRAVAEYFAPVIEAYAKQNASWTDRTGNARQGLHGYVEDFSSDVVALYLSYGAGIDYSIYLELAHNGRYAIIIPTFEAHYAEIEKMLKGIFA